MQKHGISLQSILSSIANILSITLAPPTHDHILCRASRYVTTGSQVQLLLRRQARYENYVAQQRGADNS